MAGEAADSNAAEVLCAICVSPVNDPSAGCEDEEGRVTVKLDSCTHLYHHDCILQWFNVRNSCPQCKRVVHSFFNCVKRVTVRVVLERGRRKFREATGEPCSACHRLEPKEALFPKNERQYCYRCRPAAEYTPPSSSEPQIPATIAQTSAMKSSDVELEIMSAVVEARGSSTSSKRLLEKGKDIVQTMDTAITADLLQGSMEKRKIVLVEVASFIEELRFSRVLSHFLRNTKFLSTLAFWIYPGQHDAKSMSLQYTLLHLVLRLLPELDMQLVKRSKLGISVMKCWAVEETDENRKSRRLAKKLVDEFVELMRGSAQGHGIPSPANKQRRMSPSVSIERNPEVAAGPKLSLSSHTVGRRRADDSSTLRSVKQDPDYVNAVVRAYTSGIGAHNGKHGVNRSKPTNKSKDMEDSKSTPDIVKFKLELYEKASHCIAEHARLYLRHKRVPPSEMKQILKLSTKEYFQSIRPNLSSAAEQCIRFPDYHKYFAVDDVIKVEAIHRVVKSRLRSK